MSDRVGNTPEEFLAVTRSDGESEVFIQTALITSWRAPIPHPLALNAFEEVLPGSSDRILSMAEKESEHRRSMSRAGLKRSNWGLAAAFVVMIMMVGGGIYVITQGYGWPGVGVIGIFMTGVVSIFVYGSKFKQTEM